MARFEPQPSVWPAADLESVAHCPACGSREKTLAYSRVNDWAYQAAPGAWNFWRCGSCQSLYLNPRPTPASIGRAYQHYYTHGLPSADLKLPGQSRWLEKLRRECFYHWLGIETTADKPRLSWPKHWAVRAGLALLKPFVARQYPIEQLAKLPRGRLLDVGCGNGQLLAAARAMGFTVAGIELDHAAVQIAHASGLDVRQGSYSDFDPGRDFPAENIKNSINSINSQGFDYVLCSHVIEHVHTPLALLDWLIKSARPGGRVFLVWPNPQSNMLKVFGRHWRGLEAPRHLCLLSLQAATAALAERGIVEFECYDQGLQTVGESMRLQRVDKGAGKVSGLTVRIVDKLARSLPQSAIQKYQPDFLALGFKAPTWINNSDAQVFCPLHAGNISNPPNF